MALRDTGFPVGPEEVPPSPRASHRWRKIVGWVGGILVVLLAMLAIGVYALLHSASFHNYVVRTAQQKASDSLNTRVTLQNFTLHLSNLSLDLYGLTVYGVGPGANAPVLQVDRMSAGVRVISVLHRQWNLDNLEVDHPVVKMLVDKSGQNNLPTPKPSNSNSQTDLFDLAVRHALLERGELYYNDRKTPLEADLHDLNFVSNYDTTDGGRYFGTLAYRDGHLKYDTYAPVSHDLSARFDARRWGMTIEDATLKSGQSQLRLNASVKNYSNPVIHAKYNVVLATGEFRRALNNASLPVGVINVDGTADYTSVANQPLLNTVSAEGQLSSRDVLISSPSVRTNVRDLRLRYRLANGDAALRDLRAGLLGGELTGSGDVRNLSGKQQGRVVAALHGLSLADLKNLAGSASLKQVTISGGLNATAEANWTGTVQSLVATANATVNSTVAPANRTNETVPLNAAVHAGYNNARQEITLNQSYFRTPQTTVDLNGTVSKHSALQVRAQANDLHELETIASLFTAPKPGQPAPQPLGLAGTASFNGTVSGSTSAPQIAGELTASNVKVRNAAFKLLRTNIAAGPSHVSLQQGELEPAQQGRVAFNIQLGLKDWSYTASSPIVANVNASQLSLADLSRIANSTAPVSGTLNANLALHGSQLNPVGQGEVRLSNAKISGEPIQAASLTFQGTGDEVHANLLARIRAGTAKGQVTYYPKQQGYDGMLQATNIQLGQIQTLKDRHLQIAGTLNLNASGRGTLKDPQGQATLTIPQLDVQKQQIKNINLQASVANQQATFALHSQVLDTPLQAEGKVGLTGDYYADAKLDTPLIQLQPFVAVYSPAQANKMSGQTEIHASLRGPLKNKAQLEAHLNIPALAVDYKAVQSDNNTPVNVHIAAVGPIRADYVNDVLALQPAEIKGTDTDIRFEGRMPLQTSRETSTLKVTGTVDLGLAELFDPELTSAGKLQFDINAAGHSPADDVAGQIQVVNASFAVPDAPLGLSNGNGVLTLRRDRLDITQFTGEVGGGRVTASGSAVYRPSVQFAVAVKGQDLRMLYPQSVRSDLGVDLALRGTLDSSLLSGQVTVDRVSFTPDFDLSNLINQFGGDTVAAPSQGFADNMKLNIALRTPSELNAVSRTLSLQGDANLRVIGTASNPVIVGRANLTGGDLIFFGNRYLVEGGTIAFVNTVQTEPVVNLEVNTTIQQYNIALRFQGPLDRLHTNYTSDPALASADIINLLAFGQTQEAQAAQAQPGNLGAESAIASQVTSQVTSRLEKVAGISQLSVDPVLAGSGNQTPGARITIQQRVTSKVFVTFATDVTNTQDTTVQLQYHVNRKWSLSGTRDQNGGFGLDVRYNKTF